MQKNFRLRRAFFLMFFGLRPAGAARRGTLIILVHPSIHRVLPHCAFNLRNKLLDIVSHEELDIGVVIFRYSKSPAEK